MTQQFADELVHFAEHGRCQRLMPVIERLRSPLRVAVIGRHGVGRTTVATALRQRGVVTTRNGEPADVHVLVVAEVAKPEDLAVLASDRRPALIVLTKADLAGAGPGGPLAVAARRAAAVEARSGVPAVPMVGLLATLDDSTAIADDLVLALRSFATEPPNLAGVDAFVDGGHAVQRDVRVRLLNTLDRFGIAHAVLALTRGVAPTELTPLLQRLGNADGVMTALELATAAHRYRRLRGAVAEIRSLAVGLDGGELDVLLAADATVLAVMAAAVAVLEADGLVVDRGETRAAHSARAVRWGRYGRGPVNPLHRQCSTDVVRGSLRLLATAGPASP